MPFDAYHLKTTRAQRLSWQVLAYLKGRKQGVSRAEHQGTQLLPCSLIQKVWDAMREQEMVSAGDVKSLEKQIVEERIVGDEKELYRLKWWLVE